MPLPPASLSASVPGVGAVDYEDDSSQPPEHHHSHLTEVSLTLCRADGSFQCLRADQVWGDMAQGNNYGQTSNGVADESPNMLVYRKVRLSSLS